MNGSQAAELLLQVQESGKRSESHLPRISVIIPSRNRPSFLVDVVSSILAGTLLPDEIIVIDQSDAQHPTLFGMQLEEPCRLSYHRTAPLGVSAARNLGLQLAVGDVVAMVDDDMIATTGWLKAGVENLLDKGQETVLTGQVPPYTTATEQGYSVSTMVKQGEVVYEGSNGRGVLYSGNMMAYKNVLLEVGAFDEALGPGTEFPGAEDNDLCMRLLWSGYRISYVPQMVLYHRAWRTGEEYQQVQFEYGLGQGAFYAKHARLKLVPILSYLLKDLAFTLAPLPIFAITDQDKFKGGCRYIAGLFVGAARWTRRSISDLAEGASRAA